MNSIVNIFCIALFLGSALGGGSSGGRHYRGAVIASAPVYSKTYSAPIAYSKTIGGPAVATYAHAPAVAAYHSPEAYQYSPYYAQAVAPAAVQYAAPTAVQYAAPAVGYAAPSHVHAHAPAAYAYAAPSIPAAPVALLSTAGKPQVYSKSVPAAAIRNIETVMVTKTITPVVTKTTTHHTHAEPALSLGHVQGYSQGAVGHPKLAPVQFNTQYTSYSNPTVGVNGPVVYSGGAVGVAPIGVAAAAVGPEPVAYKSPAYAVAAGPAVYKTAAIAPSYVVPGAALSYDTYGIDAHSIPVSNFLELRSGHAVHSGYHK